MKPEILFGWTTCLTYETRKQLGFKHYSELLDEMKQNAMKRLIVMMGSHGFYDPKNHGLAWPVRNPKLQPMVDANAINSNESTEFFSELLRKAKAIGIEIYVEIKYQGVTGLRKGYPKVEFLTSRSSTLIQDDFSSNCKSVNEEQRKRQEVSFICPDSDQAHQYMRDKLTDLLQLYPDLDGIVIEGPRYRPGACYCQFSRKKFEIDTGKNLLKAENAERIEWQNRRIKFLIADLIRIAREINGEIQFGIYSGFSPENSDIEEYQRLAGHQRETLQHSGVNFVMPYCEGRHRENEEREIERVIVYMEPLSSYVHCTIRRNPPENYPLPLKHPEYISRMIRWAIEYHKKNNHFRGMSFFNEVNIPQENREAVYEAIKGQ